MKLVNPINTLEVVPNLAWVNGQRAVISLYSLRHSDYNNSFGCDFQEAIKIVKIINQTWNIEQWCFDWSAERDLALAASNDTQSQNIFDILQKLLLDPLKEILPDYHKLIFMHGDANTINLHQQWREITKQRGFDEVVHHNRFFYHYNSFYPSAKPEIILRGSYTTFNRKHTTYRKKLLDYLKNNQLLEHGYVNFQFENVSTLINPLVNDYESSEQAVENQIYRYYRATNFDIIVETASFEEENQQFLTEKTLRALALGQPFLTYNGTGSLQYLRNLGFKTYNTLWDENYDTLANNGERFDAMTHQIPHLISNRAIFEQPEIKKINEHNKYHFQKLAELDHRECWFRS